jgi:hypothetical protein
MISNEAILTFSSVAVQEADKDHIRCKTDSVVHDAGNLGSKNLTTSLAGAVGNEVPRTRSELHAHMDDPASREIFYLATPVASRMWVRQPV